MPAPHDIAESSAQFATPCDDELDRNFLHAIYTPFSFILFYEVLLLVLALPKSHTSSIGKQYEIVSLIVIRGVFKDIGEFRDPAAWLTQLGWFCRTWSRQC